MVDTERNNPDGYAMFDVTGVRSAVGIEMGTIVIS